MAIFRVEVKDDEGNPVGWINVGAAQDEISCAKTIDSFEEAAARALDEALNADWNADRAAEKELWGAVSHFRRLANDRRERYRRYTALAAQLRVGG